MGIFDKLMGSKDIKLTSKGALALAAMTMIAIDGSIEDAEVDTLLRITRGDNQAFDSALKVYKDRPVADCVQLVSSTLVDQKQRIATIAILLDIAMTDGMLAGAEKDLTMAYINAFQVSEEIVKDIAEVVALKNDFSVFA